MLTVRTMDPADALTLFRGTPPLDGLTRPQWDAFCAQPGLRAFAAEEGGALVGFALAASHPRRVHVLNLEGRAQTCRLLLDRLVEFAGARGMSGWFPTARADVRRMLGALGFRRQVREIDFQGRPSYLYRRRRGEDEA
jgi:hypothetical protein